MQSNNPVFGHPSDSFNAVYGQAAARSETATIAGVINKTGLLAIIAIVAGFGGYRLLGQMPSLLLVSNVAAFITCIAVVFLLRGKPQLSPIAAPVYAVVEGVFLGALTAQVDNILVSQGLKVFGGVGLQAFVITISALIGMLALYKTGVLRASPGLVKFLSVAGAAIFLTYLISFALGFFGISVPLIGFASAASDQGTMGLIGLGLNVFILGVATLFLIMDFAQAEAVVASGSPKYMEWYCGFGLIVTLAWIYFEAVKMVLRIAVLFGGRD